MHARSTRRWRVSRGGARSQRGSGGVERALLAKAAVRLSRVEVSDTVNTNQGIVGWQSPGPLCLASSAVACRVWAAWTAPRGSPRQEVASNRARQQATADEGSPKGQGAGVSLSLGTFYWTSNRKCLGRGQRGPNKVSKRNKRPKPIPPPHKGALLGAISNRGGNSRQ